MEISTALKSYLVAKGWLTADADDPTAKAVVAQKMIAGELNVAKIGELNAPPATGAKSLVATAVNEALAPFLAQMATLTKAAGGTIPAPAHTVPAPSEFEVAFKKSFGSEMAKFGLGGDAPTPTKMFNRNAQAAWLSGRGAEVTKATARFDNTKSAMYWGADSKLVGLRGKRLTAPSLQGPGMGRPLDSISEQEKAVCGAFFKWSLACNSPGKYTQRVKMTDIDHELIRDAIHDYAWCGNVGGDEGYGVINSKLTDVSRKALLDDSTSGGITLVPQVFDDAIIQIPLLYGELFPYIMVEDIVQGRRIEAPIMSRPTFTSGIADGTNIPLFTTTGFISALDTTVYAAVGSMQIGNDIQEDTPVANLGGRIIANYGEAAQNWLDMVIAIGDGSTQPLGVFNTSGITAVQSANSSGGPVTVGDLEGTMFGVAKAFRTSMGGNSNVYIGNETTYRRIRGIPIGTAYNGRVFGENYGDYTALGFPYKIYTGIPNNQLAFVNLAYYKMYRRLGTQVKVTREGQTLVLADETLISVRMRYGGQLVLAGAMSYLNDLES